MAQRTVWNTAKRLALVLLPLSLCACSGGGTSYGGSPPVSPPPPPPGPAMFHCGSEATCPRLTVNGDPVADAATHWFRGYGDPSLERDPATGDIWLSYSWLDTAVSDPGPPEERDRQVHTRLARSIDGGVSFDFVRPGNTIVQIPHPSTGEIGWTLHEVSTLVKRPVGDWELLYLTYFDPLGEAPDDHRDFYYSRTMSFDPTELGNDLQPWARGTSTAQDFGVFHDLGAEIPEMADCAVLTEPMLFSFNAETFFATNCITVDAMGMRDPSNERIVLLKEGPPSYQYVGVITDSADATDLGVDRLEQGDISIARDGTVLFIVTPISDTAPVQHGGCIVFEFANFTAGTLVRDINGRAVPRAILSGDATGAGPGSGPGLCTYDADSATGVLMITKLWQAAPLDIEFVMRQTGFHP